MLVASFLRCATLSSVTCLALPNYSTLYHKQRNFTKKGIKRKICLDFFYKFCPKFFSF
jgi:hypothetical protein